MKKILSCVIMLFVLSASFAQTFSLIKSDQNQDTRKELISSNISSTIIKFTVNSFELKDVITPKGNSSLLVASKATPLLIKDAPDVLKLTSSFIIPNESNMKVEVLSSSYRDFPNIDLAPSKGNLTRDIDPGSIPYVFGADYKKDQFFPGKLAELNRPYILNDYRAQSALVYPFQYNPVSKVLRVYYEIEVKISIDQSKKPENVLAKTDFPEKISEDFYSIYERRFINFKSLKYTPLKDHGKMLIISHSNYIAAMQPFIKWKIASGIPVEIVDVATIGV
ncbi:MAG: C25 family peptidase propeptide domain-containing protein, partial [Flavobacterium sp.]|nr:C25 family peptidase propeptide domain-containing protein [Flavobacterium sp.]